MLKTCKACKDLQSCLKTCEAFISYGGLWSRPYTREHSYKLVIPVSRTYHSSNLLKNSKKSTTSSSISCRGDNEVATPTSSSTTSAAAKERTGALDSAGLYRRLSKAKLESSLPVGFGIKGGVRCPHNASTSWVSRKQDCDYFLLQS